MDEFDRLIDKKKDLKRISERLEEITKLIEIYIKENKSDIEELIKRRG